LDRKVLTKHWPTISCTEDIKDVGRHNLATVDLIAGGFPCQDLSIAGVRAGLAGERSGLWFEFHRVIAELKPRWQAGIK
jgi:DNA (cytosine-5)-methyltransferase 1